MQKVAKRREHAFDPKKKASYFDRQSRETSDIKIARE